MKRFLQSGFCSLPRVALLLALVLGFEFGALVRVSAQDVIQPQGPDVWKELGSIWNPFAEKLNAHNVDLVAWHKVLAQIYKMEGCDCPAGKGRL